MILRQSTAVVVSLGPFVDKTDGVTLETGLVSALDHASTGIMLSKNGAAKAVRHATVTASTYDAYGDYNVTLDTTDTNTVGRMRVSYADAATCCPVWRDFQIVEEAVYDAMFASAAAGFAAVGAAMTLTSAYDFAKGTVAMTESYNADGAAPTPVQAIMLALQMLTEKSVSSTTLTVKKLDGSTSAATFTLNDASNPTSITRAT